MCVCVSVVSVSVSLWNPGRDDCTPGTSPAGTQTGGARKWEGPEGEQRKTALLANPERQRERGMCLQGQPLGPAPG